MNYNHEIRRPNLITALLRNYILYIKYKILSYCSSFWARTQFPGVIGAIDGTHIAIVPPNAEREHLYINRKLYHSLNVLIVCMTLFRESIKDI